MIPLHPRLAQAGRGKVKQHTMYSDGIMNAVAKEMYGCGKWTDDEATERIDKAFWEACKWMEKGMLMAWEKEASNIEQRAINIRYNIELIQQLRKDAAEQR